MRTQEEIEARIKEVGARSVFGFAEEVLTDALEYGKAKPYLKPEVTAEQWAESQLKTDEDVRKALASYLDFAWGKAEDHRGLSANRSIIKLTEWVWLLGRDDVVKAIEAAPYPQYGCPKLEVISDMMDLPKPGSSSMQRMMDGLCCSPDCENGCGS